MDNVSVTPGVGSSIATDDIAGVQYQRVKMVLGADGVNGGDVASGNPMPISGPVTVSGSVTVASHDVTNAGTFAVQSTSVVPGTGATNLGKAEDAAAVSGDTGVAMLAVRTDVPTVATSANGDYAALTVDAFNQLRVTDCLDGSGSIDTFGHIITGRRNNQIDIQFFRGAPSTLVTVSLTGSGSATQSVGGGVFAVGATTTSSAKGVTAATTYYSSGGEIYTQFTASFPTAGGASSFQRIGLYDDNNGFFLGYENATFGIVSRYGAADTQVAKASWNTDTLTGASNSKFTRNGVPEAIDLTFANVYRIRFGWLGEAPVTFEVLSPDGKWVVFHVIKQPNTSANPSIQNPELPMTCHVNKTAGATNYSIITYCWGAGCTVQQRRANDSLTTSTIMDYNRAIIAGETTAGGGALVNIKVNPSGSVQVAGTTAIDQTTPGTTNAVSIAQLGANAVATGNGAASTGVLRVAQVNDGTGVLATVTNLSQMAGAAIAMGTGVRSAGTQRVTIATDDSVPVTNTGTFAVQAGTAAHDAAISGNPLRIAGRALTSDYTAVSAGDTADLAMTLTGKPVNYPFALPGQGWSYAAASGGIVNTTGITIKAAGGAGVRNYITCLSVINGHATVGTDVQIRDGASGTVLWRGYAYPAGGGVREMFSVPIRGTANTLLEVACGTTGSAVYVNVQGFSAAE